MHAALEVRRQELLAACDMFTQQQVRGLQEQHVHIQSYLNEVDEMTTNWERTSKSVSSHDMCLIQVMPCTTMSSSSNHS